MKLAALRTLAAEPGSGALGRQGVTGQLPGHAGGDPPDLANPPVAHQLGHAPEDRVGAELTVGAAHHAGRLDGVAQGSAVGDTGGERLFDADVLRLSLW